MSKLLILNPNGRLTAEQALEHPYVAQFHNPADEPAYRQNIKIPIDDYHKYSIGEYRNQVYADIVKRKKQLRNTRSSRFPTQNNLKR